MGRGEWPRSNGKARSKMVYKYGFPFPSIGSLGTITIGLHLDSASRPPNPSKCHKCCKNPKVRCTLIQAALVLHTGRDGTQEPGSLIRKLEDGKTKGGSRGANSTLSMTWHTSGNVPSQAPDPLPAGSCSVKPVEKSHSSHLREAKTPPPRNQPP